MSDYNIYWGDFHTHHNGHGAQPEPMARQVESAERLVLAGRDNIDFFAVLSYPFMRHVENGFNLETVYADFEKNPYGSAYPGDIICVAGKASHEVME